jgi:hypothetical protein
MHTQINKQIQRCEHITQFQIYVQTQTRVSKHTLYNFKSIHKHKQTTIGNTSHTCEHTLYNFKSIYKHKQE